MNLVATITNALMRDDIAARLKSFPHDQYLHVGGFMRSIALAAGTIVLLEILGNFRRYHALMLPWIATFLACLVTITTWGRGVLLANSPANLGDLIFPMLMGIAEVCMFTILSPRILLQREPDPGPDAGLPARNLLHWAYWFVVITIHAFLAVLLVLNRLWLTNLKSDFASDLQPLAERYINWMHGDVIGASICTVLSGASALFLLRKRKNLLTWSVVLTLLPIAAFIMVPIQADHQRKITNDFIFAQDHK